MTGGNIDLNYSPSRTNVNQNLAGGFLFNPSYTGGLALTLTQPLLRNAGIDVTKTFIRVAQNNAIVEEHVFRDRVLTVLATVEQTYWEVVQAKKNLESSYLNTQFSKNQLLPTLSFQGTMGLAGLGKDYGDSVSRNFGGDFYNYGAGLVLSYPLGNRAAWSTYNKRQLEARNAEASLVSVRQQIIVGVREAVRRVQTDFKRIETTRSARIMAEKQLQAERERLNVGLSTTRFVLDFQRDLATAQGNELRATVDYNKSLSNLARHKATTLDRYNLQLN